MHSIISTPSPIAMLTVAAVLVGCTQTPVADTSEPPVPSPPPSERVTPATPAPTPVDIADAFVAKMTRLERLQSDLSGELRVGERTGKLTGTAALDGDDSHEVTRIEFADGTVVETETMTVGDWRYERDGKRWIRAPRSAPEDGGGSDRLQHAAGLDALLGAIFDDARNLELEGYSRVDGRALRRLAPVGEPEVSASMLGLDDPAFSDFRARVVFLAEADGTPGGFILDATWTHVTDDGKMPGHMRIVHRFDLDRSVTIRAPKDAWQVHASDALEYSMRHPVTWTVQHDDADPEWIRDVYLGTIDEEVQVVRFAVEEDVGAAIWFRWVADAIVEQTGSEPTHLADLSLANGLVARVFETEIELHGRPMFVQQASIYGGQRAWDVYWWSRPGTEEADRTSFMDMLLSFEPLD